MRRGWEEAGRMNSAFSEVFLELCNFPGKHPIEFPTVKEIVRLSPFDHPASLDIEGASSIKSWNYRKARKVRPSTLTFRVLRVFATLKIWSVFETPLERKFDAQNQGFDTKNETMKLRIRIHVGYNINLPCLCNTETIFFFNVIFIIVSILIKHHGL